MTLFAELSRRNVFRVAIGYVVSCWLLAQIADLVLDVVGAPAWILQTVVLILALGFPVVVFFSWAYEVTPEGIKRESEVDRSQSITHVTARKLDRGIIAVLVLALVYFVWESRFAGRATLAESVSTSAPVVEQAEPPPPKSMAAGSARSIAVLPFVNLSDDKDYFADGLTEELLNLLTRIPDLKVAGRTSSFSFKGRNEDLRAIGEALSVNHVLEGSVRRSGDRLRITAQLISVDDGYHLWSQTYDREMADIFDIQDDVSQAIAGALELQLAPPVARPTGDMDAYALFLEGLAHYMSGAVLEGIAALDRSIAIDPRFAKAWELKAGLYWLAGGVWFDAREAQLLTWDAASRALELDPSLAAARALAQSTDPENYSALRDIVGVRDWVDAEPDNVGALEALSWSLLQMGYATEALVRADRIVAVEPLFYNAYWQQANALFALGRHQEAFDAWTHCVAIRGGFEWCELFIGFGLLVRGEDQPGVAALQNYMDRIDVPPMDVREFVSRVRDPAGGKAYLDAYIEGVRAAGGAGPSLPDASIWYLVFGYLDDYWDALEGFESGAAEGGGWSQADNLVHEAMVFRATEFVRSEQFLDYATRTGFTEVWDELGAPDFCRKPADRWICDAQD